MTIALGDKGFGPKDVSLRQLAELLEATAATYESVAAENHVAPPTLSLSRVKSGSAAYVFVSEDRQADRVTRSLVTTVKRRGRGASPQTRNSLMRLHRLSSKSGPLRIQPPSTSAVAAKPVYLSSLVPDDEVHLEEGTVVYGRIVGLKIDMVERGGITLRYDDGGQGDFAATTELVARAAPMIGHHVSARVTFIRGEERDWPGEIEEIEERPAPGDFMEAVRAARLELAERGIAVDSTAWSADEDDER